MNKEKIEKQLSDIDMEILSDLKKNLADEMSKPADERDEKLISELEEMISETEEEVISASRKRSLDAVMKMLDEYEEPKYSKLFKRLSIVAACLVLVFGLNAASLRVCGQNMFSAVYQFTKNTVIVPSNQSGKKDDIVISESDPYGMKGKCAEYGFFPDTPSYIPEGFVLDNISVDSNNKLDCIFFYYKNNNNNAVLIFYFTNFKTNAEIPPATIPTDTYNVTEEQINGHTVYILKEDNQYTVAFSDKKINYSIFAENLDYDECYKILESLS